MEFNKLLGFLGILKKSNKIMLKNGRLMVIVTSIYIIISSLFFFLNISTIKPMISDLVTKAMQLPSLDPQGLLAAQDVVSIQKDVKTLLGVELAFVVALFATSFFAQNAMILLTGVSYKDEKIFPKDLLLRMLQSSTRLFVTSFYVTLLRAGFFYFGFIAVMISTVMVSDYKIVSKVIICVLAILYLYFSVVWLLALVVSVLEECSGIEALGKAGEIVKGKKLEGFSLNLLFNLLSYVFFHVLSKMIVAERSELTQAFFGFFSWSCICLIAMFMFQAYTVLYFECKKNHGEAVELQGRVEYSKIPGIPLVDEDLP